ncbi:hypothetical protein [Streptomyces tubercidicus]
MRHGLSPISPHVDSLEAAGRYVQYVVSRLDKGKKFLARWPRTGVVQIESMESGWGAGKKPWILNPLYANRTVREENGRTGRTTVWFDSFRALQGS